MKKEFIKTARKAKEELLKLLRTNLHVDRYNVRYNEENDSFEFFVNCSKGQVFTIKYESTDSSNSNFKFTLEGHDSKTPINILIENKLKEWECFKYIKSKIKEMSLLDLYNYLYEKFPVLNLELEDNILFIDDKYQIYKNRESEFIFVGDSFDFYHRIPSFDVNLDRITRLFDIGELPWGCLGSIDIVNFLNRCSNTKIDENTTLLNIMNNNGFYIYSSEDYNGVNVREVLNSDLNKVYEFSHDGVLRFNYKDYTLKVKLIVPKKLYDEYEDYEFIRSDYDIFNEVYLQFVYYKPDDFDSHEIEVISFKDFKKYDVTNILYTVYDKILGKVKSIAKLKN